MSEPTALPGAPAFSDGGSVLPSATAQLAVQLACVLCLCLLLDTALRPLHLPAVVAEKVAGILLGPSALGATAAGAAVFSAPSLSALKAIANVGLVLYMFETGASLDIDDAATLLRRARLSLLVSISGLRFGRGARRRGGMGAPRATRAAFTGTRALPARCVLGAVPHGAPRALVGARRTAPAQHARWKHGYARGGCRRRARRAHAYL